LTKHALKRDGHGRHKLLFTTNRGPIATTLRGLSFIYGELHAEKHIKKRLLHIIYPGAVKGSFFKLNRPA